MLNPGVHEYLTTYEGSNAFVQSLKKQFDKKGSLSDKQIFFLTKTYETDTKKDHAMSTKTKAPVVQSPLFTYEPLETVAVEPKAGSETPQLDGIQEMLEKIAAGVVTSTMAQAEVRIQGLIAKVNALQNTQVVMHVRLNEAPIQKLSREAHPLLPKALGILQAARLNLLLVGPTGSGKTTLAQQVAEAMGKRFGHICFTSGASESWLFGRQTPNGFVNGEFAEMFENGGVFLGDEFDAADANLLLCVNTAIENKVLYNPISGRTISAHPDFYFVAGANTFGLGANAKFTGRNRLDEATLSRFGTLYIDYNEGIEAKICADKSLLKKLHAARKNLAKRNATQGLSTRDIAKTVALINAGFSEGEAIHAAFTASWPQGLAKEVGLADSGIAEF